MSVYMAPPTPSTIGLDRVCSSIVHPSPLNSSRYKVFVLLLFLLFLFDKGETTGISHFNDVDFRVFFNMF